MLHYLVNNMTGSNWSSLKLLLQYILLYHDLEVLMSELQGHIIVLTTTDSL